MARARLLLALLPALAVSASPGEPARAPEEGLAPPHALEREAGWRSLFDGRSTAGWRRCGGSGFPEQGWSVRDGCLHLAPGGRAGDLVLERPVGDFELEFEWKVAPGANGGVKYRVLESEGSTSMLGCEYQLLDDTGAPSDTAPAHRAAALYDLFGPEGGEPAAPGVFHRSRIVARGARLEHWLDGVRVVAARTDGALWAERLAASKFAGVDGFAAAGPRTIGLQDHGGEVWFRNLRLREYEAWPGQAVELFDGRDLEGWRALGDARWTVEEGTLLGQVGGGGQSFLTSERAFGDFLLEVDLRNELPGNAGLQIRSHERDGRLRGYQVEVDPDPERARFWSGGLYDEARRGWLDDLSDSPAARAAFRPGEWNTYRVECLGPWIRTWVNGVPAADCFDPLDLEGHFGLQVHSGTNTRVRWRDFRLRDLGTRSWVEALDHALLLAHHGNREAPEAGLGFAFDRVEDFALRLTVRSAQGLRLHVRAPGAGAEEGELAPGLTREDSGWTLDPYAVIPPEAAGEEHVIVLCAYGDRVALHLDGERKADLHGSDPVVGLLLLGGYRPPGEFTVELLGEPERR
jgi:hypothetical protein